jgi:16S rRNA (uracil1498-N3)-methyltransferase
MQLRRFYCEEIPAIQDVAALPADEARHAVQVLRLREGDPIALLDGRGCIARAEVVSAGPRWRDGVSCRIVSRELLPPPRVRLHLYVAPPRGKAMGLVVRSAVELGVWRLVPVMCEFGTRRVDEGNGAGRHWEQDVVAAMKQSGNAFRTRIDSGMSFADALSAAPQAGYFGAVPRRGSPAIHADREPVEDVAVWIGPEGGFTEAEEECLVQHGYQPLAVGRWILRVETAVPALLGSIIGRMADD